ncbi:M48 family metallopeptidase [Paraliomyxa miuraensis]|uniref:M48 family metallopeptidase n=1 Tax=Paraliomyxa miuraensis TaxID=376150 RepID=UPI0022597B71|nr:SprT family zinc-dependent metalloprotease [Paraliomyxa miuraensis]MCX4241342.1 M48 family metallopeptidase [Paraliomyxa miuraensis]
MTADLETSRVQWGRTRIDYAIRRSTRRKTVAVAVDPVQGVLLTAPQGVAVGRLDEVVRDKARWIVERLRTVGQVETPVPPRQLVSGESYLYLGRAYRLRVRETGCDGAAKLVRGWLEVPVRRGLAEAERRDVVLGAIGDWYRTHARARLPERVDQWAARLGVEPADVLVRDQRKRWASCDDSGVLRFNWRVIQAPMRLVDYVVAHELVHLRYREHTAAFWARLGMVMPDYEARKEALRRLGPRLHWG